jgi:molecular chaperone DnaK
VGAAIQAGVLEGDVKDILLLDVTPLSLGIETLGGVGTVLIQRNTTIPTSKSESFTTAADNQPSVEVHVVQGERPMAAENKSIGRFMLDGILPSPRGVPQIEVVFDIDADGILKVSAKDKATSKEQHITIAGRSGLSDEDIERAVEEAEAHADEDRARREGVEARNAADSAVYAAEKLLKDEEDKVPADVKPEVEAAIEKVRGLLAEEGAEAAAITAAVDELQQTLQQVGQAVYAAQQAAAAEEAQTDGPTEADEKEDEPDETVEGEFREV